MNAGTTLERNILKLLKAEHIPQIARILGVTPNELCGFGAAGNPQTDTVEPGVWGMSKEKLINEIYSSVIELITELLPADYPFSQDDCEAFRRAIRKSLYDYTLVYTASILPD